MIAMTHMETGNRLCNKDIESLFGNLRMYGNREHFYVY